MAMKVKMINVYDQKATIIYSDDRDLLVRNLLAIFCIEEDDVDERLPKDVAFITTPYKIEISEELHGKLLKTISDIFIILSSDIDIFILLSFIVKLVTSSTPA